MLEPIAYLTCELKWRDLPARTLIASHLVEMGYTAVVGQQWSIFSNMIRDVPKGAVLFKSTNKLQAERMGWAQKAGHAVFASDEECLPSAREDFARTTDPMVADVCDAFLATSADHAAALAEAYPALAAKLHVIGSARIDLLRNAQPARPIIEPYVLYNSSLAMLHSIWGSPEQAAAAWMKAENVQGDATRAPIVRERRDFEIAALREAYDLVDWLIANRPERVVVRPHPQEDGTHWRARYGDKVLVAPKSDPVPWMRHAALVIHSESTTGVEAAIMGVPVLNLSPQLAWHDRLIVSRVNGTVTSAAEAISAIRSGELPIPRASAADMFPRDGARRTAKLIAEKLPAPAPFSRLPWMRGARHASHIEKFSVSLEEIQALVSCRIFQLDDSIFALMK